MIKVSIEVGSGAARFSVAVLAENLGQAVGLVEERYPGGDARVLFPIEGEAFFVRDPAAEKGLMEFEMPESLAG